MIPFLTNWHNQTSAVLAFCSYLFCSKWVSPKFGIAASLLLAFCSYSAIYVWAWEQNRYVGVDVYNQMALRYFAADSIAKIMMICFPLMVLSEKRQTFELLGTVAVSAFVIVSSSIAIFEARHGCPVNSCGGLIGNPSISMGLLVCMLPILLRSWRKQWPVLALSVPAVFISQSSIAVGLLAVYSGLWLFPWKRLDPKRVLYSVLAVAGIFGVARLVFGGELTNDSDRFMIWKHMMYHWSAPGNILLGTGIGSYHVFSIMLQHIPGQPVVAGNSWWNSMHNDWLEAIFWGGAVGGLLLFTTYCSALFKLYREKDWQFLLSAVLFGIYMFLDPALRNPIPCVFGAWLFTYALRKPNKEYLV